MRLQPTGSNSTLARAGGRTLKIFFGERVPRAFVLPVDRHNPPTLSVIEKLNAVDPAHERLGVAQIVTRFVCAPNVCNPAKLFDPPRDFFFVEAVFLNERLHALDVALDVEHLRRKINIVPSSFGCSWNQARAGKKQ